MTQSYILWIVEVNTHAFIMLHVATLNFIDGMICSKNSFSSSARAADAITGSSALLSWLQSIVLILNKSHHISVNSCVNHSSCKPNQFI